VVAGDEDHAGAAVRHLEDAAHDFVVGVRPVPALAQPPAVDDVADEVERLALVRPQEVDQHVRVAAARAEVDVRDPDRAVLALGPEALGIGKVEPGGNPAVVATSDEVFDLLAHGRSSPNSLRFRGL
jgi:hypothetical protein